MTAIVGFQFSQTKKKKKNEAESLLTKMQKKTRMPSLSTSIQHSIGSPSYSNQTRKKKKSYPNWEGGSEIVIINRWYDTIYGKS